MYPPVRQPTVKEWLEALWASLQRAGEHFSTVADVEEDNRRRVSVKLFLQRPVPKEAQQPLKEYIQQYSFQSGWAVSSLKMTTRYVSFSASRATSRFSKNA